MHPPLFRKHPDCEDVVEAFVACHDENPRMKFLGACNTAKTALDDCFREEKIKKRTENLAAARKKKAAFKKRLEQAKNEE